MRTQKLFYLEANIMHKYTYHRYVKSEVFLLRETYQHTCTICYGTSLESSHIENSSEMHNIGFSEKQKPYLGHIFGYSSSLVLEGV